MSLEAAIGTLKDSIEGLRADLAQLPAGGAAASAPAAASTAAPATTAAPRGRPPKADKAPTPTMDEVKAAAFAVRDKLGKDAAAAIIKKHGADSMAKLEPKKFAAFIAECNAELEADPEDAGGDDEL